MDRQSIAYLILAILAVIVLGVWLYRRHHGHERSYGRRQRHETKLYNKSMADRAEEDEAGR